jgi:hypothetical protein
LYTKILYEILTEEVLYKWTPDEIEEYKETYNLFDSRFDTGKPGIQGRCTSILDMLIIEPQIGQPMMPTIECRTEPFVRGSIANTPQDETLRPELQLYQQFSLTPHLVFQQEALN